MTKNDLKLIGAFIDTKNLKEDLNYAHLLDDGIYATDTRKAIHYNIPMLNLDICVHKKILAGFANILGKDNTASINGYGYLIMDSGIKMKCDNLPDMEYEKADMKRILKGQYEYKIELKEIDDIHFELTQKECFVDDIHLNPIIEHANCNRYTIFFNKQKTIDDTVNTGKVKIIGLCDTEDEKDLVKFTAIISGREFKSTTQEQLLMEM